MDQKIYYLVRSRSRAEGEVLPAGSHGRAVAQYKHLTAAATNGWKLAIEFGLETCRLHDASTKPSRFESSFAFLSLADAEAQRPQFGQTAGVYEVELVDSTAPRHIADYDLYLTICRSEPSADFIRKLQTLGRAYWDGVCEGTRELLTGSDLRVRRRLK
ncbi:MAG: hypothetical protein V4645_04615 [Pseudomonadota bacterium]